MFCLSPTGTVKALNNTQISDSNQWTLSFQDTPANHEEKDIKFHLQQFSHLHACIGTPDGDNSINKKA